MEVKPKLADIDLGEVLGVGAALSEPKQINGVPFIVLPAGWRHESLEKMLAAPARANGTVKLGDVASFIRYVNKHKDEPGQASKAFHLGRGGEGAEQPQADPDDMQTVIYVDLESSKFRAVFNAHSSDAPGWGDHVALYECPLSKEWQIWTANNGANKAKDQEDFAIFIEQNMLDIHTPAGATMLEIVTTLKSTKNVQFDSGLRLQDGQVQIKYHEEAKAGAGAAGQLTIPEKIVLGIPVYVGGEAYAVEAMFRYRIHGTKMMMWYEMVRPHKILEDALSKVITQVQDGTKIQTYST